MINDIPVDAWAIRQERWDPNTAETLTAPWHKTAAWLRRDGIVSGIITACNRIYNPGDVRLAGDLQYLINLPDSLCADCWPDQK